ncbi:MAG: nucleotidyltransferase family protein [Coriobacteriia bacterium]|nr:nucleotidyltransferase family protein [Coriobacteriia bacterium]MCL2536742.1 nucleotidyltransferase family protein [Coriobacteriia bacterium]
MKNNTVNESSAVDAIILAGGDGSVIDPKTAVKGMVEVAGKPMVQWVLEALRQSVHIRHIAVVLPPDQNVSPWEALADHVVENDGQVSDNILAGHRALNSDGLIISVTSDVPSLTPEAIDDFIERTIARDVQLSYPMVREAAMLEAYPGSERSFFKLREGKVTGGNAMILDSRQFDQLRELGQEIFEARKNPLRMANMVGLRFAAKLATGKLSTEDIEQRVGSIIGMKCAALIVDHASIGADVDKPADVLVVEAKLTAEGRFNPGGLAEENKAGE